MIEYVLYIFHFAIYSCTAIGCGFGFLLFNDRPLTIRICGVCICTTIIGGIIGYIIGIFIIPFGIIYSYALYKKQQHIMQLNSNKEVQEFDDLHYSKLLAYQEIGLDFLDDE